MKCTRYAALAAAIAAGFALGVADANADTYTPISFTGNGNIQSSLINSFPTGSYTPSNNSFGASFTIPASGNNFNAISGSGSALTINTSIFDVTNVFTLINAYSPNAGDQVATVQFNATGGVTETFDLVAGTNIRDFYQGSFSNSINGTTTQNAFSCSDPSTCLGGGGTGDVNSGSPGTYVVDEQDFSLDPAFALQTLTSIVITNTSTSGATPIVLGVTAADIVNVTATPLPGALPLFASGLGVVGLLARRRKRKGALAA